MFKLFLLQFKVVRELFGIEKKPPIKVVKKKVPVFRSVNAQIAAEDGR